MSRSSIRLYQYDASPFCAKVRRTLHYKGLQFETRDFVPSQRGSICEVSSTGRLPVLDYDEDRVADSTAIAKYLDARHPDPPIYGASPKERALIHILEDWADESLYYSDLTMRTWPNNMPLLLEDLMGTEPPWRKTLFKFIVPRVLTNRTRVQGKGLLDREAVCREVDSYFDAIEALLSDGAWLIGNDLSAADIAVASMCHVFERAEESRIMMTTRDSLKQWRLRVDEATLPQSTSE